MSRKGENPDERTREDTKPTPEVTVAIPEVKKTGELTDDVLGTVAGGQAMSDLSTRAHEMNKGVVQSLRG